MIISSSNYKPERCSRVRVVWGGGGRCLPCGPTVASLCRRLLDLLSSDHPLVRQQIYAVAGDNVGGAGIRQNTTGIICVVVGGISPVIVAVVGVCVSIGDVASCPASESGRPRPGAP